MVSFMDHLGSIALFFSVILWRCEANITCSFETDFCSWKNTDWKRSQRSNYGSVGPQKAYHGNWFIQTDLLSTEPILRVAVQQLIGGSCLKFRYHMSGSDSTHLEYGYYIDLNNLEPRGTEKKNEDFWACSTFSLLNLPQSATGIYFKAWKDLNSADLAIVALDNLILANGTLCSSADCPAGPILTTSTTTTALSVTTQGNTEQNNTDIAFIAGGAAGGVVLILIIIAVVCVIKRKYRGKAETGENFSDGSIAIAEIFNPIIRAESVRRQLPDPSYANRPLPDPSQTNRPLPSVPAACGADSNTTQQYTSNVTISNGGSSLATNQIVQNQTTYIHVPPDCPGSSEEDVKLRENFADVPFDPRYRNTTESYLTPAGLLRPSQANDASDNRAESEEVKIRNNFADVPFDPRYRNTTDSYLTPAGSIQANNPSENRVSEAEEVKIRKNFGDVPFDPRYRNTTDSYLTPAGLLRPSQAEFSSDNRVSEALSDNSDVPFQNVTDDDYLCPIRAVDNQYESDPTKHDHPSNEICLAPSDINVRLSEIPALPVPIPANISASRRSEEDYVDAASADYLRTKDESVDDGNLKPPVHEKSKSTEGYFKARPNNHSTKHALKSSEKENRQQLDEDFKVADDKYEQPPDGDLQPARDDYEQPPDEQADDDYQQPPDGDLNPADDDYQKPPDVDLNPTDDDYQQPPDGDLQPADDDYQRPSDDDFDDFDDFDSSDDDYQKPADDD